MAIFFTQILRLSRKKEEVRGARFGERSECKEAELYSVVDSGEDVFFVFEAIETRQRVRLRSSRGRRTSSYRRWQFRMAR